MKKVLLASTALVLSAGIAAADVTVGGDGRMGIIDDFGSGDDLAFTSRIRISFAASGTTDGGLQFGGSVRVDNYESDQATNGLEGSVFVSGAFGTLSMGDVSGAPEAAVGDVSGVGFTGLGDLNEATYLSDYRDTSAPFGVGGDYDGRPAMRYDYSFGAFGVHLSADNPNADTTASAYDDPAIGVAVSYDGGMFTAGLGYETVGNIDHIIAGGSATFSGATVKAFFGQADLPGPNADQWGISLDYTFGATTATAFYVDKDAALGDEAWGVGASYDLGGGAALEGGYVSNETTNEDAFDFGITMSF